MKKTKELIAKAREMYELDNSTRALLKDFTDKELGIESKVKSWDELEEIEGAWVNQHSRVIFDYDSYDCDSENHSVFATEMQAYAYGIAAAKLSQCMARLGDECDVDWSDFNQKKWCIVRYKNKITVAFFYSWYNELAFKTKEVAIEFKTKNLADIKTFYQLR